MAEIDAAGRTTRDVNAEMKRLIAEGITEITIHNPGARHNLAVAVLTPVRIRIAGSAGYYGAGLNGGAAVDIAGSAGWGVAESMLEGHVRVQGSAGSGAAAAIRGGTVVIHGDAAARVGISMKGGEVIVAGNCGYMAAFMAQKGMLIVCGDAGEAFADSMYSTVCYVGGRIGSMGTDAVLAPMEASDMRALDASLRANLPEEVRAGLPKPDAFQKVVAGRKLWNFDKREWRVWQEAL